VTQKTDLLIEGYPRSGNTYARIAFLMACNNAFVVSSHLHCIGNVRRAIRLDKPILILIRKPLDAVSSYLVYQGERLPARQALYEYIDFYTFVLNNREHIVVASFEEVTESFDQVIARINQHFDTTFPLFEPTEENNNKCMELIRDQISPWLVDRLSWSNERKVSMPASGRGTLKQSACNRLEDVRCQQLLVRAERLYETLVMPLPPAA
jgi:hypothetical protein